MHLFMVRTSTLIYFNDIFGFCILYGIDIELCAGLVVSVLGFFKWFEDVSLELAKTVKQWNVKIVSVRIVLHDLVGCFDLSYLEWGMSIMEVTSIYLGL